MAPPRYGIDVIRVTRQDVIESCLVEDANDNGKPAAPSSALRAVVKMRHGRRNSGSRQHGLLYQRHPDNQEFCLVTDVAPCVVDIANVPRILPPLVPCLTIPDKYSSAAS